MKVHFIAMGGAVMHQMAIDLHTQGHEVTGSDDEIFDPARSNLEVHGLLPEEEGWHEDRVHEDLDAVVLGMHAKEDNPELKKALERDLKIFSFPEFVYEQTKDKLRVSISGSHGKTTTTAMIMHVLQDSHIEFDYLVGSKLDGFDKSVSIEGSPILIAEGDEYPASTLNKIPKFLFLKPQIAVLTGIAWDHINVFPTYELYFEQFRLFLKSMEPDSVLIYNNEDPEVVRCVNEAGHHLILHPYSPLPHKIKDGITYIQDESGNEYGLQIFGTHNLSNMSAAMLVCKELGVGNSDFCKSISEFTGTAKRLELIAHKNNKFVYRDFAHAPSKVKATMDAVVKQFEGFHIVACLELHTYSSLNIEFMDAYRHCMDGADEHLLFYSEHALQLKRLPNLNQEEVAAKFDDNKLEIFTSRESLESRLKSIKANKIVYLMMSSGNYDGMTLDFMRSLIE